MKEIKFKAITLEWEIIDSIGSIEFFTDWQIMVNWDIPVKELIQRTWLKDREGIEIYEGDIVKFKHPKYDKEYNIYQIDYSVELWGFTVKKYWDIDRYFSSIWVAMENVEVIWNAHQHPHLLTKD